MSPTASTRSRTAAGCWPAHDMTDIPPMECPMSTNGPVGQVAAITDCRSRPRWSTVQFSSEDSPDRP